MVLPSLVKLTIFFQFQPEDYTTHHEAVFVDATSTVNLLAGISLTSLDTVSIILVLELCRMELIIYSQLKFDAKKTLELLDQSSIIRDPFTEVFLKEQRDLPTRFDTVIRLAALICLSKQLSYISQC